MTSGGVASKLGNWYEETALLPFLLRLLQESISWVQWEGPGDDDGIDFSYGDGSQSFGVQCKHRSSGTLRWSDLGDGTKASDLLAYAAGWLDRGPTYEFRLQADATFPALEACCAAAREDQPARAWRAAHAKATVELAQRWSLNTDREDDLQLLQGRCRRFHLDLTSQAWMEDMTLALAQAISSAPGLLLGLLAHRSREHLGRQITAAMVRGWARTADCPLRPGHGDRLVGEFLARRSADFCADIHEVRGLAPLERPETARVMSAIAMESDIEVVLLHGPPGSGKSEILSACVERWNAAGLSVFPLRLDRLAAGDLDEDLPGRLIAFTGGSMLIVVCDQFDTITWAGGASHPRSDQVGRFLRRLREQVAAQHGKLRLIIGCRSLDASQDTQLQRLFRPPSSGPRTDRAPSSIEVKAWSVAEVESTLARSGIASADLDRPVLALARTPIFLRLVLTLARARRDMSGIRSIVGLLDAHWEWAQEQWGDRAAAARECVRTVISRMRDAGHLGIPRAEVDDPETLKAVLAVGFLGILRTANGEFLVPGHQLFIDAHIARTWASDIQDATTLLTRIGERRRQTLRIAGALRLAVPRLRQTAQGRSVLAEVLIDPQLRPLVQVAALRGMSADLPLPDDAARVVAWLGNPDLRPRILAHLLQGSAPWVAALEDKGWLTQTWTAEPGSRQMLVHLLASVAQSWGDGVARLVQAWTTEDPEQLADMRSIFWYDPGHETDELFRQRVRAEARGHGQEFPIPWELLLAHRPERALRLMQVRLPRVPLKDLVEGQNQNWYGFPARTHPITRSAAERLGASWWAGLNVWWNGLPEMTTMHFADDLRPWDCLLAQVGELIAIALASTASRGESTWLGITQGFNAIPLRSIDRWLLLRCGAHLTSGAAEVARDAINWFQEDPDLAGTQLAYNDLPWRWAEDFLRVTSHLVDEETIGALESWLLSYKDPWTTEQEARRYQSLVDHGSPRPSRTGMMAHALLPMLPQLGLTARSRLDVLRRKFARQGRLFYTGIEFSGLHTIGSAIPDSVARTWSPATWIEQFHQAERAPSANWPKDGREFTVSSLASQLAGLAAEHPGDFIGLARLVDQLPVIARSRLISGLGSTRPPNRASPHGEAWQALPDGLVADLLGAPAILDDPSAIHELARVVQSRPTAPWPEGIISALFAATEISIRPPGSGLREENALLFEVLNQTPCVALLALADVARHATHRVAAVLALARAWATMDISIQRLAAALAVLNLRSQATEAVDDIVLVATADVCVAAHHDLLSFLLWLRANSSVPAVTAATAQDRLVALGGSSEPWILNLYGSVLIFLKDAPAFPITVVDEALAGPAPVRVGMARELGRRWRGSRLTLENRRTVLRLADDDDPQVRRVIDDAAEDVLIPSASDDAKFFQLLLRTQAIRTGQGLLRACDRQARLLVVEEFVHAAVDGLLHGQIGGWEQRAREQDAVSLVARLVEEAHREGSSSAGAAALDDWDRLLATGTGQADERLMASLTDPQNAG